MEAHNKTKTIIFKAEEQEQQLCYLVLFDGDSSSIIHLPPKGERIIGRGQDAHIQISDESISRLHARIIINQGESWLVDLDSHNGTLLNGERLSTPRPLLSGDQLQIGESVLIYHAKKTNVARGSSLSFGEFSQQCTAEIGRSQKRKERLCLMVVYPGSHTKQSSLEKLLTERLPPAALLCWSSPEQLLLMLPQAEAKFCEGLQAEIIAAAAGARVGLSVAPTDGFSFESLLSGARTAAQSAMPGTCAAASQTFRTLKIGASSVLIADPVMIRMYELMERLAATSLPILIIGETGVGKELASQAIHHRSPRRDQPLIELNCAALQENLIEGELFGYQRGAFTGATAAKQGLLEAASGGTLFLDEIAELPLLVQAKLLRVLETQKLTRLGEVNPRSIDLRLVAATNRNLEAEVKAGRFRQDLYFRLKGALLHLPPLRDRPREIQLLARTFLADACAKQNRPPLELSPSALQCLAEHSWPGNVRELRYIAGYIAAIVEGDIVEPEDFLSQLNQKINQSEAPLVVEQRPVLVPAIEQKARSMADELREMEKARIISALEANSYNQTHAAKYIQMPLRTFLTRLKLYGITRPTK